MRVGSPAASRATSSAGIIVPVGLFGLAMKTSAVRSLAAARIASTSVRRSRSRTSTGVAPAASALIRYMPKPCSVWMTSVPGPAYACVRKAMISSDPAPQMIRAGSRPCTAPMAARSPA